DRGSEAVRAVLLLRFEVFVLAEQLAILQRSQSRLEHDVTLEIENTLERFQRHIEQKPDARGQRLEKPDVGYWRGQLDVSHTLAPHAREGNLDRALLTDDALVLHALVLAAQALIALDLTDHARAGQAIPLRRKAAVVDGLRLCDFTVRSGQNRFRARIRAADLV